MSNSSDGFRVCVVRSGELTVSESFIRAHVERLPGKIELLTGWWPRDRAGVVYGVSLASRLAWRVRNRVSGWPANPDVTAAYVKAFRRLRPDVVLAEYGVTGVQLAEACRIGCVPLVTHFHGYDATVRDVITENGNYQDLFASSAGIVAVSRHMETKLLELGVDPQKLYYNSYGVDLRRFEVGNATQSGPVFLAVGRFVEKKAPHLTLLAFARVLAACPNAELRMIGDGLLLPICQDLVRELGLADSVTFLGAQSHEVVQAEMRRARAFVQHSVEASNGDCEGTPVAILEAGASGLPVVATRHAGITEVVLDGLTGLLVDERDVSGMAERMLRLAVDSDLAGQIGSAAAQHIRANYSMEQSISNLSRIIRSCAA